MTALETDELPPRPRRRLATPWTVVPAAIVIAAAGFVGGVSVEKGKGGSSGSSQSPAAAFSAATARQGGGRTGGGFFGGGGGGPSGTPPVTGQVSSIDGRTLDVKQSDGTTVPVKVLKGATVTRTSKSSVGGIHPGDTVIVTSSTRSHGTVRATRLAATASAVGGGGFRVRFGG
jgi:hypothetical protein